MKANRNLQPGDYAMTDYNGNGLTKVQIVARSESLTSQSGICYRVNPPLKNGTSESWYDSGWFFVPKTEEAAR